MRKIIVIGFLIMFVLSSISVCYGQVNEGLMFPKFVSVSKYSNYFNIDESGEASYTLYLSPKAKDGLDRVTANVKITNTQTSTVLYNETNTMEFSYLYTRFGISDSIKLSDKGSYKQNVTFRCYKNNRLIETITAEPQIDSF